VTRSSQLRALFGLIAPLVALQAGTAWAGTPVVLPRSEDPNLWAPHLPLVDFDLATDASPQGPRVEFVVDGVQWIVVATGADGEVRVRAVGRPTSSRDRENLVSIANSLLNPPEWTEPSWDELSTALPGGGDVFEALPILPAPPSVPGHVSPTTEEPVTTPQLHPLDVSQLPLPAPSEGLLNGPSAVAGAPIAPLQSQPTPQPQTADPVPQDSPPQPSSPQPSGSVPTLAGQPPANPPRRPATVVDTPLRLSVPPPPRVQPWVRSGAAYAGRQGVAAGIGVDLAGGVIIDRSLRVGVEIAGMSPARINGLSGKRTSGDIDIGLLLNYVHPRIGLMFGVQGGYGFRIFESEGAPFAAVGTGWFAPVIGWDIPLGKLPLQLEPYGTVRVDTRPIDVSVQGSADPGVRRGVVGWRGGIRVVFAPELGAKTKSISAKKALSSSVSPPRRTMSLGKVIHPSPSGH